MPVGRCAGLATAEEAAAIADAVESGAPLGRPERFLWQLHQVARLSPARTAVQRSAAQRSAGVRNGSLAFAACPALVGRAGLAEASGAQSVRARVLLATHARARFRARAHHDAQ